ncbi:hypothetical protein V8C42DRAFT_71961 [Trichoderma barbatum]
MESSRYALLWYLEFCIVSRAVLACIRTVASLTCLITPVSRIQQPLNSESFEQLRGFTLRDLHHTASSPGCLITLLLSNLIQSSQAMALVIGLVAAAARAISNSNDHDRHNYNHNNGYNNGRYCNSHNNRHGNNYNSGYHNGYDNGYNNNSPAPYAAYAPHSTGSRRQERRMNRKMRKADRKARDADMVLSLMSSGSRSGPRSPAPPCSSMHPQPVHGGVSYMHQGDSSRSHPVYYPPPQGNMAPEPEGYQWRHVQSRDRPGSREDLHPASSSESLPTYEQVVRQPGKSRR